MRFHRDEIGARRYEAFGRVMAAFATEPEMMETCRDLGWWPGTDGWEIEWREGPFATEVADLLIERVREPGFPGPLVGPLAPVTPLCARLDVMGVSFDLRAIDPLGLDRMRARPGVWRLSEALDPARRTGSRQPWEELLGG
ncbi:MULTISPECIES: hypothetical protein [Herbidospora]|nr:MULTISPECIES: hypothetical protein [Herbidospora]